MTTIPLNCAVPSRNFAYAVLAYANLGFRAVLAPVGDAR